MSIDFGGTVNQIGFDDITFGSAEAGGGPTDVPASAGILLMPLGVGLLARKRIRQS